MKRFLTVALIGAITTAAGCSGDDAAPAAPDVELSPTAVAQIESLIAEKNARTPAQRKISSQLLYARSDRFAGTVGKVKGEAAMKSLLEFDGTGRVLVDVKGDVDSGLARVASLGGTVVDSSPAHRSYRAWVQLAALESLAAEPSVKTIRPAMQAKTARAESPRGGAKFHTLSREQRVAAVQRAVEHRLAAQKTQGVITRAGAASSEGTAAHGSDRARKFYNTDGSGVKIGVLSDSDDFKEASIASGDLPADMVTVPGQDGRPGGGEGTAMLEIIHDMAPGAQLYFATAFNSPESFAENIRTLRFTYGCDIIVDDIIYYFESPFQDDIIAQAVDDVVRDGAMYFSSAGNEGNYDDGTSGTWEGDFNAEGTLATLPSGYTVHDFGDRVISNRIEAFGGPLVLYWSDPGTLDEPESSNDYDVFVLDQDLRNVLVASTDVQDGTGLPSEFVGFLLPANLRVVVARHPGAKTRALHVSLFGGELGLSTPGAIFGHNSAPGAFAVAAVDAFEADGGTFTAGPTTPVELFSSDGGRRIFYDRNGRPLRGGVTFASGGGVFHAKPDISGADGVVTTLPGGSGLNPFFGTSAAAPHVAGVAALVMSALPNARTWQIRRALTTGALDIEARGTDRNSGPGIASTMNTLRDAGARPQVYVEAVAVEAEDVVLPGATTQLNVQVANNGGATATNVTATLSSTSPYVTVTAPTGSYPNLAAETSASNTTPIAFTVAAGAPCGELLAFTLVVRSSGRGAQPRELHFSLPIGRPTPATTYSYAGPAVEIPDGDDLGVDVPLTVTGSGAISNVTFHINGDECTDEEGAETVGVDHSWVGDLVFTLTSPTGRAVTVINQAGGPFNGGNNLCQTVLDDSGESSVQAVLEEEAPFTGTFSPANPLAGFIGDAPAGVWTLHVADLAGFDSGSVRSFSVDVSGYTCE